MGNHLAFIPFAFQFKQTNKTSKGMWGRAKEREVRSRERE